MRIHFYTHTMQLASTRLRTYIPALQLMDRGHDVTMARCEDMSVDVSVFSKHFNPEQQLRIATRLKNHSNALIVMDVCDDHFDRAAGPHYRSMIDLADLVIVNTEAMSDRVRSATKRHSVVVRDPVEGTQVTPMSAVHKPTRLLWFGHPSNLSGLEAALPKLPADSPIEVVSAFAVDEMVSHPAMAPIHRVPWSKEVMPRAFLRNDIVIVPVGTEPHNRTKSCNRAVEALRAGKFVVAESGISDYKRLKDFIWIGDLSEGIEWARTHSEEMHKKIRAGQEYIVVNHDPVMIGKAWEKALMEAWHKRFAHE